MKINIDDYGSVCANSLEFFLFHLSKKISAKNLKLEWLYRTARTAGKYFLHWRLNIIFHNRKKDSTSFSTQIGKDDSGCTL